MQIHKLSAGSTDCAIGAMLHMLVNTFSIPQTSNYCHYELTQKKCLLIKTSLKIFKMQKFYRLAFSVLFTLNIT